MSGNPHSNFVAVDTGPSFSDDWFGWSKARASELGREIGNNVDSVLNFITGTDDEARKVIEAMGKIDEISGVLGGKSVFGNEGIAGADRKLNALEARAAELEKRNLRLIQVLEDRKIKQEQADVFGQSGILTPVGTTIGVAPFPTTRGLGVNVSSAQNTKKASGIKDNKTVPANTGLVWKEVQ